MLTDRTDGLLAVQRLADDARNESGRRRRRRSRADDDRRKADDAAIDETTTRVLVDEDLGDELAASIAAFRTGGRLGEDFVWKRATKDSCRSVAVRRMSWNILKRRTHRWTR